MKKFLPLIFLSLQTLIATDNDLSIYDELVIKELVHETNPLFRGYAAYDKNNHRVLQIYKETNQDGVTHYFGAWDPLLGISHLSREQMFDYLGKLKKQQDNQK